MPPAPPPPVTTAGAIRMFSNIANAISVNLRTGDIRVVVELLTLLPSTTQLTEQGRSEVDSIVIQVFVAACERDNLCLYRAIESPLSVRPGIDAVIHDGKTQLMWAYACGAVRLAAHLIAVSGASIKPVGPTATRPICCASLEFESAMATAIAHLPQHHTCPITLDVITDAVLARDGRIYQRDAIERWTQANRTSPVTGAEMDNELRPVYGLNQ